MTAEQVLAILALQIAELRAERDAARAELTQLKAGRNGERRAVTVD